jgi:GNAT superfamily N-acetyltransferase
VTLSNSLFVVEEPIERVSELAAIPIRFAVRSVLDVEVVDRGLGGITLVERPVAEPYQKDYDAGDERPGSWASRFDVSSWGLLSAYEDDAAGAPRIGAAVLAWKCPESLMLEGRDDLAVLWDLRVEPRLRRRGIGGLLFRAAEEWARGRGCKHLEVETQNVNVSACRFYRRHGCTLGGIDRFAYPTLPGETRLVWYREL